MVAYTSSAIECAITVKAEISNAIGAHWENYSSGECYAVRLDNLANPSTSRFVEDKGATMTGCQFSGKYIVTETFIYMQICCIINPRHLMLDVMYM